MSEPSVPLLEVRDLSSTWGDVAVLRSVSFTVGRGELLTLLGPNGAGKSTLLRAIAGFERPTAGAVLLDGRNLAGVPPHRRSIGMLFQEPTLFPHRTVYENLAYAPMLQHRPDGEVRDLVGRLTALLKLEPLLDRWPTALSGGEQQRVALARTLAARPRVVLLDEPFASVDVEIRATLHAEFRSALREFGTAAVHVTHDRAEGLFLGDRVGLLFDGSLEAIGPPSDVYAHPTSKRTARFLGYNVLNGPEGPVAVLPEDLEPLRSPFDGPSYLVQATGAVGRGYLSVLVDRSGARVEVRSDAPIPVGSSVGLRWTHGAPLR